jgi:hypothetical protein
MSKFSTKFQEEMENHIIKFKEENQYLISKSEKKRHLYSDISDNFFPSSKYGLLQYIYENGIPLHEYVNSVRSSQAFAFNLLFFPLQKQEGLLKYLSDKIGQKLIQIKNFEFEYSPDKNILGEWKSDENRPEKYVTSVDLFIETVSDEGYSIDFLFEVKFTESEFGTCSGYDSNGNVGDTRTGCDSPEKLLDDYKLCYLNGAKLKRTYFDEKFNPKLNFKPDMFVSKCPFERFYQCLRNHSLSYKMDHKTYFCLVYHDKNSEILDQWQSYKDMCKDTSTLLEIRASDIVKSIDDKLYQKYFRDKYLIS